MTWFSTTAVGCDAERLRRRGFRGAGAGEEPARRQPRRHPGGHGTVPRPCADCHGIDARRPRARYPQVWASGRTDGGLFKTINGVPGTEMPAHPRMTDQNLADPRLSPDDCGTGPTDPPGNAENGERIFRAHARAATG